MYPPLRGYGVSRFTASHTSRVWRYWCGCGTVLPMSPETNRGCLAPSLRTLRRRKFSALDAYQARLSLLLYNYIYTYTHIHTCISHYAHVRNKQRTSKKHHLATLSFPGLRRPASPPTPHQSGSPPTCLTNHQYIMYIGTWL